MEKKLIQTFQENIKKEDLGSNYMKCLLRDSGSFKNNYNSVTLDEITTQVFEIIDLEGEESDQYEDWEKCRNFVQENIDQIYEIIEKQCSVYYYDEEIEDILNNNF